LKKENRIVGDFDGSNTECNFVPKMNYHTLVTGYKNILKTIYSSRQYYERINTFLRDFKPRRHHLPSFSFSHLITVWKVFWILGIWEKGKTYYWRLLISTALKRPRAFPVAMKLAIYGYHFRRVVDKYVGKTLGVRETGKSTG
jgi:hypothetical protein